MLETLIPGQNKQILLLHMIPPTSRRGREGVVGMGLLHRLLGEPAVLLKCPESHLVRTLLPHAPRLRLQVDLESLVSHRMREDGDELVRYGLEVGLGVRPPRPPLSCMTAFCHFKMSLGPISFIGLLAKCGRILSLIMSSLVIYVLSLILGLLSPCRHGRTRPASS